MLSAMNHRHAALVASAFASASLSLTTDALAHSGGMTGVSVAGCNGAGCHGASSLSTSVRIEGASSVVRGSMNTYTLVITNMGFLQDSAGFDVAATSGALGTAAGATQTQLRSGEVTHSARIASTSGGTWRIPFRWSAPATAGTATINAAANATNSNFSAGGDQWNTGSLTITVTDTAMVMDSGVSLPDSAAPTPDAAAAADTSVVPPNDAGSVATPDATASDSGVAQRDSSAGNDGGSVAPMGMTCSCSSAHAALDARSVLASLTVVATWCSRRRRARRA